MKLTAYLVDVTHLLLVRYDLSVEHVCCKMIYSGINVPLLDTISSNNCPIIGIFTNGNDNNCWPLNDSVFQRHSLMQSSTYQW